ncbi:MULTISPECIES: IS110 family transposase [Paenibacillus]|uniref:IS110 family transposase n=1 Tax=Paenibacillus TaxID=44249 RepID=UPI0009D6781C|nr:transposase [Paenibacillus odorifer]
MSFFNNEDGFSCLLHWIHKLLVPFQLSEAIVGLELTGDYWLALSRWLFDHKFQAVLVNPQLVKKTKKTEIIQVLKVMLKMP